MGAECDVFIASLPNVPQVREVLLGEGGVASGGRPGLLVVDMSTITPAAAREHHALLGTRGIEILDAPVSGGPMRAADGTLTIMVGGELATYEKALPVLGLLGQHIMHVGPPGAGQAVKLVNQLLISIIMVANAEALSLGVKAGIPLQTLLDVVGTSSGSNYLLAQWLPKTLFAGETSGGFALDLLMKDLRAALEWARESDAPVFAGALAEQLFRLVRTPENARHDYSVVARFYENANGVELRTSLKSAQETQSE
jgi:3-hydroxyisobutyrate dehydrogenase-like beta-hydroxyacid dehydrogenase